MNDSRLPAVRHLQPAARSVQHKNSHHDDLDTKDFGLRVSDDFNTGATEFSTPSHAPHDPYDFLNRSPGHVSGSAYSARTRSDTLRGFRLSAAAHQDSPVTNQLQHHHVQRQHSVPESQEGLPWPLNKMNTSSRLSEEDLEGRFETTDFEFQRALDSVAHARRAHMVNRPMEHDHNHMKQHVDMLHQQRHQDHVMDRQQQVAADELAASHRALSEASHYQHHHQQHQHQHAHMTPASHWPDATTGGPPVGKNGKHRQSREFALRESDKMLADSGVPEEIIQQFSQGKGKGYGAHAHHHGQKHHHHHNHTADAKGKYGGGKGTSHAAAAKGGGKPFRDVAEEKPLEDLDPSLYDAARYDAAKHYDDPDARWQSDYREGNAKQAQSQYHESSATAASSGAFQKYQQHTSSHKRDWKSQTADWRSQNDWKGNHKAAQTYKGNRGGKGSTADYHKGSKKGGKGGDYNGSAVASGVPSWGPPPARHSGDTIQSRMFEKWASGQGLQKVTPQQQQQNHPHQHNSHHHGGTARMKTGGKHGHQQLAESQKNTRKKQNQKARTAAANESQATANMLILKCHLPHVVHACFEIVNCSGDTTQQCLRVAVGLSAATCTPIYVHKIVPPPFTKALAAPNCGTDPGLTPQSVKMIQLAANMTADPGMDPKSYDAQSLQNVKKYENNFYYVPHLQYTGGEITYNVKKASVCDAVHVVLPMMVFAQRGPSTFTCSGATEAPGYVTADFWDFLMVPILHKMGVDVDFEIQKRGAFPNGDGTIKLTVEEPLQKTKTLKPITMVQPGQLQSIQAWVSVSKHVSEEFAETAAKYVYDLLTQRTAPSVELEVAVRREVDYDELFVSFNVYCDMDNGAATHAHEYVNPIPPKGVLVADFLASDQFLDRMKLSALLCVHTAHSDTSVGACMDRHTLENIIPYLALAKGTSEIRFRTPTKTDPKRFSLEHLKTQLQTAKQVTKAEWRIYEDSRLQTSILKIRGKGWHKILLVFIHDQISKMI